MGLAVQRECQWSRGAKPVVPPVTYSQGQSRTPLELALTGTGDTPGNAAGAALSKVAQPSILFSWG